MGLRVSEEGKKVEEKGGCYIIAGSLLFLCLTPSVEGGHVTKQGRKFRERLVGFRSSLPALGAG